MAALTLLGLMAMGRVVGFGFTTWDDPHTLWSNPLMTPPNWSVLVGVWNPHNHLASLYVPVTYTVWGALATIGWTPIPKGSEPGYLDAAPFRVASLVVHLLASGLVYGLIRRLLRTPEGRYREWPALLGAALFVVHPLQVEPVGWASGFKDLLAGMFMLLAVRCYLAALDASKYLLPEERGSPLKTWLYWAGLLCFVIGWLSKPSAMVAPALATVTGWLLVRPSTPAQSGRSSVWRVAWSLWPWWLLVPAMMAMTKYAQPADAYINVPPAFRPLVAGDALTFYLTKLLAPLNLTFDYGRTYAAIRESGAIWWTWILSVGVGAALFVYRRRRPLWAGGFAWFVVCVSPVLGFTPFLYQYFSTVADHYMYTAMAGIAIAVAGALAAVPPRLAPLSRTLAGIVLAVFTLLSAVQMGTWSSDVPLYQHALKINPRAHGAICNLAVNDLFDQGPNPSRAALLACLAQMDRAIQLAPDSPNYYEQRAQLAAKIALRDLRSGNLAEVPRYREMSLQALQTYLELSRKRPPSQQDRIASSYILLAQYLLNDRRPAEALTALDSAEEILKKLWVPQPESHRQIAELRPRVLAALGTTRPVSK